MLVLSRKVGQRLVLDDRITITINRINGNRVQVGIEAPDDVHILRGELDKIRRQFSDDNDGEEVDATAVSFVAELDAINDSTLPTTH